MTLIKYNRTTSASKLTGTPTLRVSRTDGFTLNVDAIQLTGVKPGDTVSLFRQITGEVHKQSEWYLVKDPFGYNIRQRKDKNYYVFSSKPIAKIILETFEVERPSYSFRLATKPTILEDGTEGWCLLHTK